MNGTKFQETQTPGKYFGVRHIQYLLLFTASLASYAVRIAFNVGIIAIVSSEPLEGVPTYPEWANQKNVMLSSFFWGYVPTQVVAGMLAKNYGAKWFLGVTVFLGSLFCILIPTFAAFGYGGVIFCRVIQGFGQSFLFPCTHILLSKWTPIEDRAKVGAFVYAGVPLGTLISMPITGLLCKYEYVGWPVSFYIFGGIGIIWFILWSFIAVESPSNHNKISMAERQYIERESNLESDQKTIPTPWRAIFTSLPFWAILVVHCGENWGYWTLLTEIPSFVEKILHFDIASNSLLSALPYFAFWILSYVMGSIGDLLIQRKWTSRTTSRKLFTSIAMMVPVLALISINFMTSTDRAVTIFLLTLSVGSTSGIFAGYYINHIDLSPNHSGALVGITTMISNIASLLAPLSIDLFIYISGYQETDKELWSIVFYVAAGVYLVTGIFYDFGASGEVQPWNSAKEEGGLCQNEKQT